jgi:hypothetical protein
MKAKCIDNKGGVHLTIGRVYEVSQVERRGEEEFFVTKADTGGEGVYFKERFELMPDVVTPCERCDSGAVHIRTPVCDPVLPTDSAARKATPIARGVLDYFPLAIAEIARVSKAGNDQHNPGQPMHWAREKSTDHADCVARHLIDRGTVDTDGQRHTAKLAWRALALLQTELENAR